MNIAKASVLQLDLHLQAPEALAEKNPHTTLSKPEVCSLLNQWHYALVFYFVNVYIGFPNKVVHIYLNLFPGGILK